MTVQNFNDQISRPSCTICHVVCGCQCAVLKTRAYDYLLLLLLITFDEMQAKFEALQLKSVFYYRIFLHKVTFLLWFQPKAKRQREKLASPKNIL